MFLFAQHGISGPRPKPSGEGAIQAAPLQQRNRFAIQSVADRFIAVDWSGDASASGQRQKIWIADWTEKRTLLESGINRSKAVDTIIAASADSPRLIVGLDFAFSYPEWFLRKHDCESAEDFWKLVDRGKGNEWLTQPNEFCWGGKGVKRPADHREPHWRGHRRTELALMAAADGKGKKISPKSPFQIGGAGAVGTGSLRGIPYLLELKKAGFSIWPFDPPNLPVALEIYPRIFTGHVTTSKCSARGAFLARPPHSALPDDVRVKALDSEDAFDALCSVIGMKDHAEKLAMLKQATDPDELLEGRIWSP